MIVAEGILTSRGGLVSHAAVVARGWGKPAVVGAEAVRIKDRVLHRRRRDGPRGRRHLHRRDDRRRSSWARSRCTAAEPPAEFEHHPRVGRRDPQGQAGRAGQRRQRSRRGQRPPLRRRGDRAVPDRAHVPGRGPAADRAAHDPGRHARGGGGRPGGAAGGPEGRLRRDPRGHGRPAGHGAAARPAAARVPARRPRSWRSRRRPSGLTDGGGEAAGGGRAVARVQPHARHPRRAPRRGQARAVRHAGAGPDGGGGRAGGGRRQAQGRGHDPAHRDPGGDGAWPGRGSRSAIAPRHGRPVQQEASTSPSGP